DLVFPALAVRQGTGRRRSPRRRTGGLSAHEHCKRRGPRRLLRVTRGADCHGVRPLQGRHQPQRDRGRDQGRYRRGVPDPATGDGGTGERVKSGVVSAASAALIATVAGVGGTLPIVLAAAQAVGATPAEASSWVSGLGIATAATTLFLSARYRMPII